MLSFLAQGSPATIGFLGLAGHLGLGPGQGIEVPLYLEPVGVGPGDLASAVIAFAEYMQE